jgi:hypothetical protein
LAASSDRVGIAEHEFAADSALEEAGFELVWGVFCQAVIFGLLAVLCSERESRSSFFNRAAGVKEVFHSGLRVCGIGSGLSR